MNALNRLFCFSVGFTALLIAARVLRTGDHQYVFLLWNLFLAWIPLFLSTLLQRKLSRFQQAIVFGSWLLFFPNALYLVTDLVHLRDELDIPGWYDIILVFSAVMNGLMLAYTSMVKIERYLNLSVKRGRTDLILFSCFSVSSFGVYLGRVLRFNSWTIFVHPFGIYRQVYSQLANPLGHIQTWGMTATLSMFFTLFYFIIKRLPRLLENDMENQKENILQ